MNLKELKESILNNSIDNNFKILICEDNFFIANQYINAICKNKNLDKVYINSIFDPIYSSSTLIINSDNILNILKVDTFEEMAENYEQFMNTIVICNEIDKKITKQVEPYIINVPKLLDWQIQDYAAVNCLGLDQSAINFLTKATNYDIYKVDNEINKIKYFPKKEQINVLSEICFTQDSDLNITPVTDLVSAIVKKDKQLLYKYLYFRQFCDFEPTGIITQLLNYYKVLLYKRFNKKVLPEEYGISNGRAYYIDKEAPKYSEQELLQKIKFITSFDQKLKLGLITLNHSDQVDYILANIL